MLRLDWDTCEEIILTITRNKTRSLLTAFGIFWGIFMLVALMGGVQGVQDLLSRQFGGFATNSGFIGPMPTGKAYKGFRQGRTWEMTNLDVEALRRNVPEIEVVSPNITRWGINCVRNENKITGTLKGLYPEYVAIEEPQISMGRYINEMDIRLRRKVCVLGSRLYETLFPDKSDPCGKSIEVNGIHYRVVGVNMAAGNMSVQGQAETSLIVPFTTMQQHYNYGNKVQMLSYTVRKGYAVSEVEKKVEAVLKRLHDNKPTFTASSDEIAESVGTPGQADPPIGFCASSKLRKNEDNGWVLAPVNLYPTAGIPAINTLYVVEGCQHPAAAKLLIRFMMGGIDGDTSGYAPFNTLGGWPVRDDIEPAEGSTPFSDLYTSPFDPDEIYVNYNTVRYFWQLVG